MTAITGLRLPSYHFSLGLTTRHRPVSQRAARVDVLILDRWGLVPLGERERRDLLENIEDRYGN